MPLANATREQIRDFLVQEVSRYIHENSANPPALEMKPFHARLMPALFGTTLSERSFSTRLGLWFQRIALLVAQQFNQCAQQPFLVEGQLQPAVEAQITAILAQMEGGTRRPNRQADVAQVLGLQYPGGTSRRVRSDLRVLRHDGQELFFEMKTVKPNKGTFEEMKRKMLMIMAMRPAAQAYAAMSYNPMGDGNIYVPDFNQFLELRQDLIVGRDFWARIGDDYTYDELVGIAEEVGELTAHLIEEAAQTALEQADHPAQEN